MGVLGWAIYNVASNELGFRMSVFVVSFFSPFFLSFFLGTYSFGVLYSFFFFCLFCPPGFWVFRHGFFHLVFIFSLLVSTRVVLIRIYIRIYMYVLS